MTSIQATTSILPQELFSSSYNVQQELGRGRFGVVLCVKEIETGRKHAAKVVNCRTQKDRQKILTELSILQSLNHPRLIRLISAFQDTKEYTIVTEFVSGGELFERVAGEEFTLTEKDCKCFMTQICQGVEYMHERHIVHLDLKPENIMCTDHTSNNIKLIDFGLAQRLTPGEDHRVLFGTPEYVAPEVLNFDPIGTGTDIWTIGVICYVLLSGLSPFLGETDAETFSLITKGDFDFDDEAFDEVSDEAKAFVSCCLVRSLKSRPSASSLLNCQWLSDVEDEEMKANKVISTVRLKKYLLRRKWHATGNALRAVKRFSLVNSDPTNKNNLHNDNNRNEASPSTDNN